MPHLTGFNRTSMTFPQWLGMVATIAYQQGLPAPQDVPPWRDLYEADNSPMDALMHVHPPLFKSEKGS